MLFHWINWVVNQLVDPMCIVIMAIPVIGICMTVSGVLCSMSI